MASEIRVDKINSLSGVGTVTLSPTGVDIAGITTAATLRATTGIVTSLTAVSSAKVGSGITLSPDGDIFATGVTTATTFSGSGASLTNLNASNIASGTVPTARLGSGTASSSTFLAGDSTFKTVTGTTINNNANNRLITGSGTANTLEGESTLTFDGSTLVVTPTSSDARVTIMGSEGNDARLSLISDDGDDHIDQYNLRVAASDNRFYVDQFESGAFQERFTIDNGGKIGIGQSSPQKLLDVYNTSTNESNIYVRNASVNYLVRTLSDQVQAGSETNHPFYAISNNQYVARFDGDGIKFGSDTAAANALDDYEEGNWTPYIQGTTGAGTATYNTQTGKYLKIGNFVYLTAELNWTSGSAGGELRVTNMPFSPTTDCEGIGNFMGHVLAINSSVANICVYVGPGTNYCYFYQTRVNMAWKTIDYDDDGAVIMNVSFRVA